jgi:hypothetical protein
MLVTDAIPSRVHRILHGHWPQRVNVNGKDYACKVCSADEIDAQLDRHRQMENNLADWNRQAGQKARELEADE